MIHHRNAMKGPHPRNNRAGSRPIIGSEPYPGLFAPTRDVTADIAAMTAPTT